MSKKNLKLEEEIEVLIDNAVHLAEETYARDVIGEIMDLIQREKVDYHAQKLEAITEEMIKKEFSPTKEELSGFKCIDLFRTSYQMGRDAVAATKGAKFVLEQLRKG